MLAVGSLFARRYRILRPLGRGGSAQAFAAHDLVHDEEVALKVLRDDTMASLFAAEFERVRELVHPCLVRARELSRALVDGRIVHFYSADLVRGENLAAFAAVHGYDHAAQEALADILEALHVLHQLGLRHGDLKPDNVIVRDDGRAVLLDLGCAAPLRTASAFVSGTPGYLAPELLEGREADERADLYAFGVLLRELFAGAVPPALLARLCAEAPGARPGSAREVLSLLGRERDLDRYRYARAPKFVGRERELAQAEACFARFHAGEKGARVLWVHGPDGVGRSRFLRELRYVWSAQAEVCEARASHPFPLQSAFSRLLGALGVGAEAIVSAVEELSDGDAHTLVVLDDADQLSKTGRDELAWLLSSLRRAGKLFVLIASREPAPRSPLVEDIALTPLSEQAVSALVRSLLPEALVPQLYAHTGGVPAELEHTLAALFAGRLSEVDLGRRAPSSEPVREAALKVALSGLSEAGREALARVLVVGRVPLEVAPELVAGGLARVERGELVLARRSDAPWLAKLLDAALLRRLHRERVKELGDAKEPAAIAACIGHLFGAGEPSRACVLLEEAAPWVSQAPHAFVAALAPHARHLDASKRVLFARAYRLTAEPRLALSELARARRALLGDALDALHCEAAETYLALGRPQRALKHLELASSAPDGPRLELAARLHARLGRAEKGRELATQALELARTSEERARAHETLALAEAQLGRHDEALRHVDQAVELLMGGDVRARVRCQAFRGFVLFKAGRVAEASEAYQRTLEEAERHGFGDLLVNALTNLGNARQMLGSYGTALQLYDRALRLAHALGRTGSVRILRINLANLALEMGALARADAELTRIIEGEHSNGLPATVDLYRAELALLRGAPSRAKELVENVAASGREVLERSILRALVHTALGELPAADACLNEIAQHAEPLPLDVAVRFAEARAELLLARREPERAVTVLEAELARARPSGQEPLLARLEALLARALHFLQSPALAEEHGARARARWERMALDLPPNLRDAFWAHPRRRVLAEVTRRDAPTPVVGRATLSLARLLDINRRLIGSLSTSEILERAMDAAIELTLAERGFVLLREDDGALTVSAARHLAREQLKRREYKLSRSIAARVIETGEPLWTVDAGTDQRFAHKASVHAMRLKSVLCVPIRGSAQVLGALYLDNRIERARFSAADAELLTAFADQVAIALRNARLVAELEQRTRELAREKRRVEELLRGKSEQVERLAQALSLSRAALETRYDYSHIVGRSEPMRRVLAVLDRVIESDVSVLIMGESGTGKELVARAIHGQGARKDGPFVSINCAALPESLLEAELFGHVKGAFTGAERDREGLIRAAKGGTLFLDELAELPLSMQAKLLRVLADREVRPVGDSRSYPVDIRLVCATNKDLLELVRAGAFREDLYYRVAVVSVTMPPLRERSDDILPIAEALLRKRANELGEQPRTLAPDAVRALLAHPWPGNVRELENTLVRASVMATGAKIRAQDLGLSTAEVRVRKTPRSRKAFEAVEAERLLAALEAERWNVSRVARILGIPRNTLYRKLERYGLRS